MMKEFQIAASGLIMVSMIYVIAMIPSAILVSGIYIWFKSIELLTYIGVI